MAFMKNDNTKFEYKTELHQEWLGKLRDFYAEYKYIPTYDYMGQTFGIGAKSRVAKLIKLLKVEGFLEDGPDNNLMPGERFFEIAYTDASVQAGPFTDSYSQTSGYMTVLDILIKKPSITRIRPVKGNSMSKKGILDGDMAIYEKRQNAAVGDIVIAILEDSDEVTIKELGKENGAHVLIPHNDNFDIIRNKNFRIEGVLLSSFRTY